MAGRAGLLRLFRLPGSADGHGRGVELRHLLQELALELFLGRDAGLAEMVARADLVDLLGLVQHFLVHLPAGGRLGAPAWPRRFLPGGCGLRGGGGRGGAHGEEGSNQELDQGSHGVFVRAAQRECASLVNGPDAVQPHRWGNEG